MRVIRVIQEIRVIQSSIEQHIGRTVWDKLKFWEFQKKIFRKNSEAKI